MKEEHEHKMELVGAIVNNRCRKCDSQLICNEIEILNQYYEVGAFCDNEKCEMYLILVV